MRSRRLALPPSLRIDAQLEMLSSKTPQGTVLAGTTSVYLYLAKQDLAGIRQQDQVGWSEGGPHIVNQLTFVISVRERLQTHEN